MLMSDTFWELKYNRGITFIQCKCCTVKFSHHSSRAGPTLVWWHYIYTPIELGLFGFMYYTCKSCSVRGPTWENLGSEIWLQTSVVNEASECVLLLHLTTISQSSQWQQVHLSKHLEQNTARNINLSKNTPYDLIIRQSTTLQLNKHDNCWHIHLTNS